MKILSVVVPCYNSQDYMEKCINSLLPGGKDIEILIVDDGSTDRTAEIADSFEREYPDIVKAIHQKNAGHGGAVNTGLRKATGCYFKVVDSDDWVDTRAFRRVIETLRELEEDKTPVDMFLVNFIYDKVGERHKRKMRFRNVFPRNQIFGWNKMGYMTQAQYIMMHNVFYRTSMLHECGIKLPTHTFYVDNIFVFQPLLYVKKMYYLDVDLYHYFIGREDQSVSEKMIMQRIDQQIKVNKIMVDIFAKQDFTGKSPKLRRYLIFSIDKVMTVSSMILSLDGSKEALQKKKSLWRYIKNKDTKLYYRLRNTPFGVATNLPGKSGRMIMRAEYKVAQKFVGFN